VIITRNWQVIMLLIRLFLPQRAGRGELQQGSPESQVEQLVERLRETKII